METFNGKLQGRTVVSSDLLFSGQLDGDMIVIGGARVDLHGSVSGNVIVEAGSSAVIYGSVSGYVRNDGGNVEVHGVVSGGLTGTSRSRIIPGAIVGP